VRAAAAHTHEPVVDAEACASAQLATAY